MSDTVSITIPSHPRYLAAVRAMVGRLGQLCGMDNSVVEDIKLAVDEACSNIIKYAYDGDTGQKIRLRFMNTGKGFEVIIDDSGIKAPPGSIEGRSLDDIRPGGLGIHLIKRAFDICVFDEKKKKGNRLRLIRYNRGNI